MVSEITEGDTIFENPLDHSVTITPPHQDVDASDAIVPGVLKVIKRNGTVVHFDAEKIRVAISKAFHAVADKTVVATSSSMREQSDKLTVNVMATFSRRMPSGGAIHIEDIQDQVELELMRSGEHLIARAYVLYREKRATTRQEAAQKDAAAPTLNISLENGSSAPLSRALLEKLTVAACLNLDYVSSDVLLEDIWRSLYNGITEKNLVTALIVAARALIELEPNYSYVAARFLLGNLRKEALTFLEIPSPKGLSLTSTQMQELYPLVFTAFINKGVTLGRLNKEMQEIFDLDLLGAHLQSMRDENIAYLGLQTLYDRYFTHEGAIRFELPQVFFMRIAMGLSLKEDNPNARAIEFYDALSSFLYLSSTPTLFNAGTCKPQLSSCYLSTVSDNLDSIFSTIKDNALLSKWAGGLGNDWTSVRSLGAYIKGTNGTSQGVVPFLKVANDTALAVNQGGKRKGALCSYLETWHLDIEEFLELRKNTGDDRRRTHDMNTANWIPDLFMKRLFEGGDWTLFSPSDAPDLHDLTGRAFETRYVAYEAQTQTGEIELFKCIKAEVLWRKMLSMLFETGHPWITFKDACNLRSPQQHVGVVHSSNLCTEITLNTSKEEVAVCNLGSVNLVAHLDDVGEIDMTLLKSTVKTAVRMLDNVINLNLYPVPQAETANLKHRAIGLGMMGFQDCLYKKRIPYASDEAVVFADLSTEALSYFAIEASADLATERGAYESFQGSLWSRGILPIDSLDILEKERGPEYLEVDRGQRLNWAALRQRVMAGMRNSNVLAIAPTATIANIVGITPCIEPTYQNLYVKSNLSGEFTVVNPHLAAELRALNLWDEVMVSDIKYYDGSIQQIDRIPDAIKVLYATAFEVDPEWIIKAASRRQKWLDQAQSLNIYMAGTSGLKLDQVYKKAWRLGLKTTYYLRSLGVTDTEKSTLDKGTLNAVPASSCAITDPECEACQ